MAEAQGPDSMGGDEQQPFDIDPDLIDDADDDGGMSAVRPEPQAERKRGRPPKGNKEQIVPPDAARKRAFIESNVKTTLAKTDMTEVMNRYDWDSGDYDVTINRVQPQSWHGRNIQGYIAAFPHYIDEHFISENFGGGVYDLKIRGPNPRQGGAAKGFLDGVRVKISGDPKPSPMDKSVAFDMGGVILNEPQAGPPSQRQINAIRAQGGQPGGRIVMGGDQQMGQPVQDADPGLVKMSFNVLADRERQMTKEAAALRERLIESATRQEGGGSMSREALKIVQESADKAIEAERFAATQIRNAEAKHREDFEKMMSRLSDQKAGIPPELLASLTEQHRSEMATMQESRMAQLTQTQERYEREITTLREKYDRELQLAQEKVQEAVLQVRSDLQGRLDRQEDQYKREVERERERFQAELTRVTADAERRLSDLDREHKNRFERSQDDLQRRLDQAGAQALADRDSLSRSHQMHVDHLKAISESQIAQMDAQHKSQIAQMVVQNEASNKMVEVSYRSRIDSLESELQRTRSDLEATRARVTEQGDLASQAEKLKRIGDSLGSVFGLGAGALANVPRDDMDIEPHRDEPRSWFGKFMQFANSDMGAGVFDFLKTAVASAAAGAYPAGMAMPMPMMPQPGYGPPPGYQVPQQGYGPVSYAPPQSPYASGPFPGQYPQQPQQQRVVDEEYEEEIEEGTEGEGDVEGHFVDEAEPAGAGPEQPQIRSAPRPDGVVTPHSPPAPVPVSAEPMPEIKMSQAEAAQLRVLVKGLEDSMTNGVQPAMMAQMITKMAPPEQLKPFVDTPVSHLVAQVSYVSPGSPLASYQGKKFLATLQAELRKTTG